MDPGHSPKVDPDLGDSVLIPLETLHLSTGLAGFGPSLRGGHSPEGPLPKQSNPGAVSAGVLTALRPTGLGTSELDQAVAVGTSSDLSHPIPSN